MIKKLLFFCLFFCSHIALSNDPMLIGGAPVKPGEYPEVIRINSGRAYCSATIIGPEVILTAAHCVSSSGEIRPVKHEDVYEFTHEQMVYTAQCTIAPKYRGVEGDQDMSLCKIDRPIQTKFASVSSDWVRVGETITLIGYGAANENGTGGNDGILRVGTAPVIREASPTWFSFYTRSTTRLGPGDSGGPAFKHVTDAIGDHHYVAGVNSRGNLVDLSLLTALAHPESLDFMRRFERENQVAICGLSMVCDKKDPPEPRECGKEFAAVKRSVRKLEQCIR